MTNDLNVTTQKEMGMPWKPRDFSKKNKKLSGHKLTVAATAANAALKSGNYSEGQAIRIGNAAGNKASTKTSDDGSGTKSKPRPKSKLGPDDSSGASSAGVY